jgi:hypothetical protein
MSFRVSIVLYRNTSWPLYFTVHFFNSYRYIMEVASGAGRRVAANNVEQLAQADSQDIPAIQHAVEVWLAILEGGGARWFKWSVPVKARIRMSMQSETSMQLKTNFQFPLCAVRENHRHCPYLMERMAKKGRTRGVYTYR